MIKYYECVESFDIDKCDEDGCGFMDEVIAWMPLPEPYQKGE